VDPAAEEERGPDGIDEEAHAEDVEEGTRWRVDAEEGTRWRAGAEEERAPAGVEK
jgi:hypothetical protein